MQQTIPYPHPAKWIGWAILTMILATAFGYWAEFHGEVAPLLFYENGPIEGIQAAVLGVAALFFALRAWRGDSPVAFICIPLVYVLLHAMVRETPRCGSAFYSGGLCLTATAKYASLATFTVIMAAALYLRRKDFTEALKPRWGFMFWPMSVSLIILLVGRYAEVRHYGGVEEALETLAYCYALVCSIWIYRRS